MKNNMKYILCKYAIKGVMIFLTSTTLTSFLMGCNNLSPTMPTNEPQITTVTPKITSNVTSTPSSTSASTAKPITTPGPTATQSPIPDLPFDEEIKLLGIKDEDEAVYLLDTLCVYYTILDSNGNEVGSFTLARMKQENDGEVGFYDLFGNKTLFNCKFKSKEQENGYVTEWINAEIIPTNEMLSTINVKSINGFWNIKKVCERLNISGALKESEFIDKIADMDGNELSGVTLTKKEWAKVYIEAINKQFRTNSKTFDETLFVDIPTVSPTRFTENMPPIKYLKGKILFDDAYEIESKGRSL